MKIFKDKQGNKLTYKEFIERWKSGITEITPIQKLNTQLTGTKIMLIGIFLGLSVTIYGYKNFWWVAIILTGAFINTWVQYISIKQQKKILDDLEEQFKEPEEIINVAMKSLEEKEIEKVVGGKIVTRVGMDILKEENIKEEKIKEFKEND